MTAGGLIMMTISVTSVTVFFGWTLYMVLKNREDSRKLHSTMDETPDADEDD